VTDVTHPPVASEAAALLEGKNLSVRLPRQHLNILSSLAKIDDVTLGEVVRNAILAYGDLRRRDPDFAEKVNEVKRQLDEVLSPTSRSRPTTASSAQRLASDSIDD
jgi:hypothetical protein